MHFFCIIHCHSPINELQPEFYGLKLKETVKPIGLLNAPTLQRKMTVHELEALLQQIYCGSGVSAEFSYVEVGKLNEYSYARYTICGTSCTSSNLSMLLKQNFIIQFTKVYANDVRKSAHTYS